MDCGNRAGKLAASLAAAIADATVGYFIAKYEAALV